MEDSKNYFSGLKYYLKVWWMMSKNSFLIYFSQKKVFLLFLVGKLFRFVFFFLFIYFLIKGANGLAGYNTNQTLFFFLTFVFIDTVAQFLFREVYRFRSYLVSGDFDLMLVKPVNVLFRVLLGGADVIDLTTLPIFLFALVWIGRLLDPSIYEVILYLFMVVNGLLISAAFHIAVLAFGIITLEVDHIVMVYRDLTSLARFPIDIYKEPLRGVLIYLIPVGVMITFPAKVFIGVLSFGWLTFAFALGFILMLLSLKFWNFALKKYTSASS